MNIIGKTKTDFENWYPTTDYSVEVTLQEFYSLPFTMQYGVLTEFFDSIGIQIQEIFNGTDWNVFIYQNGVIQGEDFPLFERGQSQNRSIQLAMNLNNS